MPELVGLLRELAARLLRGLIDPVRKVLDSGRGSVELLRRPNLRRELVPVHPPDDQTDVHERQGGDALEHGPGTVSERRNDQDPVNHDGRDRRDEPIRAPPQDRLGNPQPPPVQGRELQRSDQDRVHASAEPHYQARGEDHERREPDNHEDRQHRKQ